MEAHLAVLTDQALGPPGHAEEPPAVDQREPVDYRQERFGNERVTWMTTTTAVAAKKKKSPCDTKKC